MDLFSFVKNSLSIVDLIMEVTPIKQMGTYWKGPCPFHTETDASFTVSPDKQIFYCFGCHASGDVISFFAKIENITQLEAAKLLAEQHNLKIPEEIILASFKNSKSFESKNLSFHVHQCVAKWVHEQLLKSKTAKEYLFSRGISLRSIQQFCLGYFPGGINNINKFIKEMAVNKILAKDLLEVGIIMERKSHFYATFEERILFPIKDTVGRFCGFGGRVFKEDDDRAKYYNSKESDEFIKGKLLFGIDIAKKSIQKARVAFLVEGYLDCIAMVQHGLENTVATLGTACTLNHLKTISRYAHSLCLIYDGDKAGQQAVLRIAQLCWEANLEVKVTILPQNADPASFLKTHGDIETIIQQSRSIFSFFIETMCVQFSKEPLAQKLVLAEKIISVIANINNQFKQDLLIQKASSEMNLPFDSLKELLKTHNRRKKNPLKSSSANNVNNTSRVKNPPFHSQNDNFLLEEKIFSVILNSMSNSVPLTIEPELLVHFSPKIQMLLQKALSFLNDKTNNTFGSFLETLNEKDKSWAIKISLKYEEDGSRELFDQLTFQFYKHNWKKIVVNLKKEMLRAKQQQDDVKLQELFSVFSELKQGMSSRGLI
jgi:DNA primase